MNGSRTSASGKVSFTLTSMRLYPMRLRLSRLGLPPKCRIQVAGPEPFQIQRDIEVSGRPHRGDDLFTPRNCIGKVVRGELDPRKIAVVADPHLAKTESAQARLCKSHAPECRSGDRGPVGDSRREACSCGLVPGPETQFLGSSPDLGLGESGVDQGEYRSPFRCDLLAGPVVTQVIGVHTEHDDCTFALGKRADHV